MKKIPFSLDAFKFDAEQIENIVNKIVPLVAAPEDHEFFRGILKIKASESTSSEFSYFVSQLLDGVR